MKQFSIYEPETGNIVGSLMAPDISVVSPPEGLMVSENVGNPEKDRIVEGKVMRISEKEMKSRDQDAAMRSLREKRSAILLNKIDKVNPVWFNSLSSSEKEELQDYRQALLDLPNTTTNPEEVVWPEPPSFLPE